jgi:hypothetical protein
MFEQVFLKVKTLLVVGRFICVCFAMLVQRLISLMRVKWLQAASRSSSSSSTGSSTSSSPIALRRPRCRGENATAGN